MNQIEARPLSPNFGAEIIGCDVTQPLSGDTAIELRGLLDRYKLILFRGQEVNTDAQVELMKAFGPLCVEDEMGRPWFLLSNIDVEVPESMRRSTDTGGHQSRLLFHQDYTWSPWPHTHLSLYADELTGNITQTVFASNRLGYLALSDNQRASFSDLKLMHAYEPHKDRNSDESGRNKIPDASSIDRFRRTVEPMIKQHPRTGESLLYVTELFTSHVVEVDPEEGERIIQSAYDALYRRDDLYKHSWQLHDLLIWDNIALQHARGPVEADSRRRLRRVAVNPKSLEDIFADADGSESFQLTR
jgi:taurine dioxygenase